MWSPRVPFVSAGGAETDSSVTHGESLLSFDGDVTLWAKDGSTG